MSINYVRWLLGKPRNPNFSFERDSNGDGLADGWVGDSARCSIYEDYECPHGQKIYFTTITSDEFDVRGNVTRVVFKYKLLVGTGFTITLTSSMGVLFTENFTPTDTDWHYYEYEFLNSKLGNVWFIVGSNNSHIIIEDLMVTQDADFQEFQVNPTFFSDEQGIVEDIVHTPNDEIFLVKPILFNFSNKMGNPVFDNVDRDQLDFLKSLEREKITIRMHDDRLMPCRVRSIDEVYEDYQYATCQHYGVRMTLEAI